MAPGSHPNTLPREEKKKSKKKYLFAKVPLQKKHAHKKNTYEV